MIYNILDSLRLSIECSIHPIGCYKLMLISELPAWLFSGMLLTNRMQAVPPGTGANSEISLPTLGNECERL